MEFNKTLSLVREYLFPAGCAVCGRMLLDPEEAWYGLCEECHGFFAIDGGDRCVSCGRPLISEKERCLPCREGEGHVFDGAFVLYPYTGRYRTLLQAYKFGKYPALGNFFAEQMPQVLSRFIPPQAEISRWVPVPPRPGKIRKTGWDQVEHLAGRLEKGPGRNRGALPVYRCLKRLPSKSQKGLNREDRKTNLRGRIVCVKPPPAEVLLFDDVFTTGSTLDACAAALKEGGAQKVYALCLFYD
ncbi:MAG: double zinc ribbon domain-containing protein [Spirochaetaceae bacterium]|jgi:ComF family protein|nr:double zinc ribbon domain-containing protein [Spirochaetaceae bacterium]